MMFDYLVRKSDFATLFRFVSPAFFQVVSPRVLLQITAKLMKNQSDQRVWQELTGQWSRFFNGSQLGIRWGEGGFEAGQADRPRADFEVDAELQSGGGLSRLESGERALQLFFCQVLGQETWIIDFRSQAFATSTAANGSGELIWKPKPYFYAMSPRFVKGVRNLYRGFYLSNPALFDLGLTELGIVVAKESLIRHFGEGDQSRVQFKLTQFQKTFADVFETCAKNGAKLDPEFFILGLILLGLYQSLEEASLQEPLSFDVRQGFLMASEAVAK